jgi:RecB family exonuclease
MSKLVCPDCGRNLCLPCTMAGSCPCKSETKEIQLPDVIRRSYIDTYETCPHKFYLEVVKHLEPPETIYTALGSDLHELFDKYSWIKNPSIEEMIEEFQPYFKKYDAQLFKDVPRVKMIKRAEDSITNFVKLHSTMNEPWITEERLKIDFPNMPSVSMAMDRINKLDDGTYEVIDWKTGTVLTGKRLANNLQVPLYIAIIKENYNIDISKFRLEYLGEAKSRVYNKINDDVYEVRVRKTTYTVSLTESIRRVKTVFSQIKNNNFNIKNDQNAFYCNKFCPWNGTHCEGLVTERFKKYGGI